MPPRNLTLNQNMLFWYAVELIQMSRAYTSAYLDKHSVLVERVLRRRRLGAELVVDLPLLRVHQNLTGRMTPIHIT